MDRHITNHTKSECRGLIMKRFMHACMNACTHMYTCTCLHICTHTHTHNHMHTHIHIRTGRTVMQTHTYTHILTQVHCSQRTISWQLQISSAAEAVAASAASPSRAERRTDPGTSRFWFSLLPSSFSYLAMLTSKKRSF